MKIKSSQDISQSYALSINKVAMHWDDTQACCSCGWEIRSPTSTLKTNANDILVHARLYHHEMINMLKIIIG